MGPCPCAAAGGSAACALRAAVELAGVVAVQFRYVLYVAGGSGRESFSPPLRRLGALSACLCSGLCFCRVPKTGDTIHALRAACAGAVSGVPVCGVRRFMPTRRGEGFCRPNATVTRPATTCNRTDICVNCAGVVAMAS